MFLDEKDLFDAASIDITDCAGTSRKITKTKVADKIAELRAAAEEAASEAAAEAQGGDMSQALYVLSEGEGSESDGEQSEDEYEGMSKAQLEARKANLTKEIAVSKAKLQKQPRTLAYQELKAAMLVPTVNEVTAFAVAHNRHQRDIRPDCGSLAVRETKHTVIKYSRLLGDVVLHCSRVRVLYKINPRL